MHDRQAETGTLTDIPGGEKRLKNVCQMVRIDTVSGIDHLQERAAAQGIMSLGRLLDAPQAQ